MAVNDRWHTKRPRTDPATGSPVKPCREHSRGGTLMYPSADHGKGDRWQVRWRDENGKQCKLNRPKKGGGRGEGDPDVYAEALDAKITAELNAGTYVDPSAGDVTLEVFAKRWREDLTGDPSTLATIDEHLGHIFDVPAPEGRTSRRTPGTSIIGRRPMRELAKKPSSVQSWVKSLENKGLSPGYIRQIVSTLSTIFKVAAVDGMVYRNPVQTETVKPPAVTRKRIVPWTLEQVQAAGKALGGRDAAMAELGAGAGLRQGEIFAFGTDEINWAEQVIHVRRQIRVIDNTAVFSLPKRRKERDVPMSDTVALMLLMQIEEYPPAEVTLPWDVPGGPPHTAPLLFVRADGRVHHRKNFGYTWPKARQAAGVPGGRENGMHVLRHTFASACLSQGVDIRTLAAWLGHEDPAFTLRIYAHLMPSASGRGRRAIDAFFAIPEPSARKVPSEE
jgi:integrase